MTGTGWPQDRELATVAALTEAVSRLEAEQAELRARLEALATAAACGDAYPSPRAPREPRGLGHLIARDV